MARVILFGGQQVDIRFSRPKSYGSMLQYFTGSKMHNISLREYALKHGFSLSEYGIKSIKNLKLKIKNFKDEESLYNFLGLDWIPPELREGTEEIQLAIERKLPKLIELSEIKGDLHIHSNFPIESSHDQGTSDTEEIVQKAVKLEYEYVGLSEHNPSNRGHNGNAIYNILKKRNEGIEQLIYSYEKGGNKLPIKIFKGLEIDIKPNGELAVNDKVLDLLDYAIVSIHSSFDLNKKEMTERIIKGLSHPKVKIFGHPTGRILNKREGYEIDWDKLFDFCLKNNKFLEISSWPERLDLPDLLIREAVRHGIRLCINSDSHEESQMSLMKYGVNVARRGWAEKKDIINTFSAREISDILS